jgi:sugar O-acyltransferase (sialic acid O-acetyltransferase NeuD family)
MKREFILVGTGGHATGMKEILEDTGRRVVASVDPNVRQNTWPDASSRQFGSDDDAMKFFHDSDKPFVAIGMGGMTPDVLSKRLEIVRKYIAAGFEAPPVIHRRACISPSATLAPGVSVMAGAIVNAKAVIDIGAILNTGSIIEHDAAIGAGTHVAPGAVILGNVSVGLCAMIGASSVVLPEQTVADHVLVPAQTRYPYRRR